MYLPCIRTLQHTEQDASHRLKYVVKVNILNNFFLSTFLFRWISGFAVFTKNLELRYGYTSFWNRWPHFYADQPEFNSLTEEIDIVYIKMNVL